MALALKHVTVRYGGKAAVDDVSLEVDDGAVLAVLGPSGCGKSTLLRAIAGLEPLAAGVVRYDGADLAPVPTHRRGFALMFQDGQLFPHQSVARNVGYPMRLRRVGRREIAERTGQLLDLVGLAHLGDRMPPTLSGGERQRVALARALAVRPRLLLLDEPLSALDRGLREELAGQLHDILRRAGTTALMVTHDQEEAFAVADRMALMRDGRLVQQGTLAEVWTRPVDAWSARFLGYRTVLTGDAAVVVREVVAPDAAWSAVALRRSALTVTPAGPLRAVVVASRATPELTRLDLDVEGLGRLEGIAEPGAGVLPGDRVRIGVDPSRLAPLSRA